MRVAAEEIYYRLQKGKFSKHKFKHKLKKMYKEGTYWGTVAGAYVGMGHGIQRICGTRDWRNAMLSGALSGALISATKNNSRDRIMIDAITGGAIAIAAELLNYTIPIPN
ncbi:PREDICTED: outer envelope pore protein 16, chloroplastic-like isoform X2 [Nelumbo nucifera]|nr:PREDICTED: outer envelope pore protein 16, chloroplastic-like isoform X2 [Nelumbo nucifera]